MPTSHRFSTRRAALATFAALALAANAPALAQAPAGGAVKFILPNAAGSGVDTIVRAAQPALAKALGQPVVIDNQPGASGVIGLQALSRTGDRAFFGHRLKNPQLAELHCTLQN